MVTKRYIKKDGKKFGPYYYESYRDKKGQVRKRYLKNYKPSKKKKSVLALSVSLLAIFLLILTVTSFYFASQKAPLKNITGKTVSSDIRTRYSPGEQLGGEILLNLKKGELIPSNTKVIITLGDEQEEFVLGNFVDYQTAQGNFYTDGTEISGSGEGYGIPGIKKTNPIVEFEVELYEENVEPIEEQQIAEPAESPENEISAPIEEPSQIEETQAEEIPEQTEQPAEETTISGQVISETSQIISGEVSTENEFSFEIPEGKKARIVEGSVKSNGESLPENTISLENENGQGIVSTDYSVEEESFGPEYLGEVELTFKINIEELEFDASPGDLTIQLVYDDNIIASYEETINILAAQENGTEENKTIEQIQNIPSLRIPSDSSTTINMNDYFVGADFYILNAENLTASTEENFMTITPDVGFRGARKATITAQTNEEEIESNEFLILVSSGAVTIKTTRQTIKVGEPVKWTKEITLENPEQINVEIPLDAENIQIKKKQDGEYIEESETQNSITGNVVIEVNLKKSADKKPSPMIQLFLWIKKKLKSPPITGQTITNPDSSEQTLDVALEGNSNEYIIEYETPAPEATEETISEDTKKIVISAPDEFAYTDIIASTVLNNEISVNEPQKIKLYWLTEQSNIEQPEIAESLTETPNELPETQVVEEVQISAEGEVTTLIENAIPEEQTTSTKTIRQEIPFDSYDLDFDNNIDYIEWIVPHLSNQTYELVIVNADTTANITEEDTFSHLAISTTAPYNYLVGYWNFDKNAATEVYDFTTYNYDGTFDSSDGPVETNNGYIGKGMYFNRSGSKDGYVSVSTYKARTLNLTRDFTISTWIKPERTAHSPGIIALGGGFSFNWALYLDNSNNRTTFESSGLNSISSPANSINYNGWQQISLVANTTDMFIYIDGTLASNSSGTFSYCDGLSDCPMDSITIGYAQTACLLGSPCGFNGTIDEIMLFNTTLTAAQISAIYNNQSARFKSSGEITFTNFADLSSQTTTNISLTACETNFGTSIEGKINNGAYQSLTNCQLNNYDLSGLNGLTNANFTIQLNSDSNNFYTPLAIQNTTINVFDSIAPNINFTNPTPASGQSQSGNSIYVNVTSSDLNDHYTFVDFDRSNILWMRMDDVDGSGNPWDLSFYSNNGSKQGSAVQTDSGYFGKGFSFDGTEGTSIDINGKNNSLDFKAGGLYSWSFWIKAPNSSTQRAIFSKGSVTGGYEVFHKNKRITLGDEFMSDGASCENCLASNTWTHIVMLVNFNDCSVYYYVNGIANVSSAAPSCYANIGPSLTIGAGSSSSNLNGTIDELIMFNRTLSAQEIKALYNASANKYFNNFTSLANGAHSFTGYAVDRAGNKNQTELRTATIDSTAPQISFALPTENDEALSSANNVYLNVSLANADDQDTIIFSLYSASLTLLNSSAFTDTTHSINFTNLSAGTYFYIASVNDTSGNSDTTDSREITLLPSCLNSSICNENSSCIINSRCVLHSALCTNNECDFTNMTVNSTIYTLYDSNRAGRNLKLTMTANSPRAPLVFLNGSSIVFDGKKGSDIGSGSAGGAAGILNITVPKLFNTTNANLTGIGGYSTSTATLGGNGGTLQLNFHGLIRNFTSPTPKPNLAGGGSVSNLFGSSGTLIYNKDLNTLPRDADVNGDGRVLPGDYQTVQELYGLVQGESGFQNEYDIDGNSKLNVIEIAKISFELNTR